MRGRIVFHEDGSQSYQINGRAVTRRDFDRLYPSRTPEYEAGECPGLHADYGDWHQENGGRGRYCPQMAEYADDPRAFARHRNDVIDYANQRGLTVEGNHGH